MEAPQQLLPAGSPLFQRTPLPRSRPPRRRLTEGEAGEIAYAFERLAEGQDGFVTPRQLKVALRAMGFPVRKSDVRGLLRDAGLDAAAPLDEASFTELCAAQLLSRGQDEELARAFGLFDISGGGRITAADLRAVARQLGVEVAPEELEDMVAEFDGDGDGGIDAAEFAAIMEPLDD
ncbi:centrin [Raphidocelis subcapitata]|uniref:Centrin n=1 Tax=Raphidocelis subcapitata TaxID=307507 RepID=A0A2V0P3G7_9CHLO|nr:centrin [Raphidocelis subcapitata]|eukprot:GBF93442.1 centrin [Raphidocelis subcapitata]